MKEETKENARRALLGMMILLLVLILVSDWTDLFGNLRNIVIARGLNDWLKILSYFPFVWIMQIFSLKLEKFYGIGVIYFSFFFILNGYVLINRISLFYSYSSFEQIISVNLFVKSFEQILIGAILFIMTTITFEQKSTILFNNKQKEIYHENLKKSFRKK